MKTGVFLSISYLMLRVSEDICEVEVGLRSELPERVKVSLRAKIGENVLETIKLTNRDKVVLKNIFPPSFLQYELFWV